MMQSNDGRQELSDLVIQEFIHSDDKKEFCESVVNDASSKKLPKTLEGSDWIYFVSGWFINPDGRYSKSRIKQIGHTIHSWLGLWGNLPKYI